VRRDAALSRRWMVPLLALLLAACSTPAADPSPGPQGASATGGRASPDAGEVVAAITEQGLRDRLEALATATGDAAPFRATGSAGYDRAATYVEEQLVAAGWTVEPDAFETDAYADPGGTVLEVEGTRFGAEDVLPLVFSPQASAEGPVVTVGGAPETAEEGDVGCRVSDYGDLPSGAVVVVPPGGCLRRDQLVAAQDAGAGAYVTYAPGAPDGIVLRPTLVRPDGLDIPGLWASPAAVETLAAAARDGGTATVSTTGRTERTRTRSVVAWLPGASEEEVVMLGAHLDSVLDGPGINDDGSGVAALLEIARALGGTTPGASIRMAFWSGEELGLQGSHHYLGTLTDAERDALVAYLNADMVGSPNGFAGVYDEDAAASGSEDVRDLLWDAVERAGGTPVEVDRHQSSDHLAFTTAGIPTGGLFSGAGARVTADQAESSGATAGAPADPCYHQPCDGVDNVDLTLARTLTAALADATVQLTAGGGP
jgi:hypothetical protein